MKALRTATGLLVGLIAMPHAWAACEFTKTPWGLRVTGCNLGTMYQGRYELMLDQSPDKPRLKLPNLRATNVDAGLIDREAVLSVDLVNDGMANAGQFEVAVVSSINDPLDGGATVGMVVQAPSVVSTLAFGAGRLIAPGHVTLPNRYQGWDICTMVVVDPPAGTRTLGSVLESNESDNPYSECCHVAVGSATCQ
jgi:hypothetical protein